MNEKITFALYFGNRGFFPGELIASAREEVKEAVKKAGYDYICMDESLTKYGAVETPVEGKIYADFLKENEGKFQGVILCLPNFGDENGGVVALRDASVPILVQAYPDEIGKMDFAHRRDAMCGKFAMCNVLRQADIPFTLTEKFVVSPSDESFIKDLNKFAGVCRVVRGMKKVNVGAIGARTTAFKTVRVDEMALQKRGINVESIDLSDIFARMKNVLPERIQEKKEEILKITSFSGYPEEKLSKMATFQAVMEDVIKEYNLDAFALRCWSEFQTEFGIAPCTSLCLFNEMGISAACEVDVPNAVMMRALTLASGNAATILDFNNNYGNEENKVILFHCGPSPISMLEEKGEVIEHLMFKKSYGEGSGVGVNKGRLKSGDITFGSLKTENGKICAFVSDGKFTDDEIEKEFFGSGKVLEKKGINDISNYMAQSGYKHHLGIVFSDCKDIIREAFEKYLDFDTKVF